jgi:dienelactone hydrolase
MPEKMRVGVAPDQEVTALVYTAAKPDLADITLILVHGAGAYQSSGFMTKFATELAAREVNTVTFNFLYTEQGRRVPDTNNKLEGCFRASVETIREKQFGCGTLVIGGKSMGGRIASQIAAAGTLHLVFSSSGRLMRILRSIVAPSTAFMAFSDSKITGCSSAILGQNGSPSGAPSHRKPRFRVPSSTSRKLRVNRT